MLDDVNMFIRRSAAPRKEAYEAEGQPKLVPKLKPLSAVFCKQQHLINQ